MATDGIGHVHGRRLVSCDCLKRLCAGITAVTFLGHRGGRLLLGFLDLNGATYTQQSLVLCLVKELRGPCIPFEGIGGHCEYAQGTQNLNTGRR